MQNEKQERPEGKSDREGAPRSEESSCSPGTWPTPQGADPNEIVSSGGSGNVHTPPSGRIDDARKAERGGG